MEAEFKDYQISKKLALRYLLHLPPGMEESGEKWPLILFLHGGGETGDDINLVRTQGLPPYIAQHPDFPFITVAPQCPLHSWWPEQVDGVATLLDDIIERYPVDTKRVYLTGLSRGGYGSWYFGTMWPERWAAVVPICGWGFWFHGFPQRACALKDTPVWAFHGAKDDVISVTQTELLVKTLRECGGDVRLTIYPEANHDSWTETYNNPELYEWLLQHKLP